MLQGLLLLLFVLAGVLLNFFKVDRLPQLLALLQLFLLLPGQVIHLQLKSLLQVHIVRLFLFGHQVVLVIHHYLLDSRRLALRHLLKMRHRLFLLQFL